MVWSIAAGSAVSMAPARCSNLAPSRWVADLRFDCRWVPWRHAGDAFRKPIGGFWRSSQQDVADEFDRLLERYTFAGSIIEFLGDPVEIFAAVHA
jgi:hypothetical protein